MQTPTESPIPGPGTEVVNNYYYDYGPPVVTYYPPPDPYNYLYSWVPYPFWWGPGFYFSGFFILHDFHRHVGFHGRPFVCSNHVVAHNRWYSVNPQTQRLPEQPVWLAGSVPPRSLILRESNPARGRSSDSARTARPVSRLRRNQGWLPRRPTSAVTDFRRRLVRLLSNG